MTETKTVRVRLSDKAEHHHNGQDYFGGGLRGRELGKGDELDLPEDLAKFLCEPFTVNGVSVKKASIVTSTPAATGVSKPGN